MNSMIFAFLVLIAITRVSVAVCRGKTSVPRVCALGIKYIASAIIVAAMIWI